MSGPILFLEQRERGVAVVWMDDRSESVNTLKREMIDEFESLISDIENRADLKVLVFASAKRGNFIVGANLDMIRQITTTTEARELALVAQNMNNRMERLKAVTVAAINGPCLGGGLEFAMAFNTRIASDDDNTRLGLPEVRLGLLPAGGGTQRMPRLIGAEVALDLILSGRQLDRKRALRAGLVDEIVAKEVLIEAAIERGSKLFTLTPSGWKRYFSARRLRQWLLTGNPLGRKILLDQARKKTLRKTRGNYPAAERILDVVGVGLAGGVDRGLAAEATAFGDLVVSPEAKQLIGIFFATKALKKENGVDDPAVTAAKVKKIGVLGAGLMGAGITYVSIDRAAIPVRLKDRDDAGLGHGLQYVDGLLAQRVKKRSLTPLQRAQTLARLTGAIDYSGMANCDLIIEAVFENLELKQQMVRDVETLGGGSAIFATNTSAIPIEEIAKGSNHPEKIIGMHYFSPVDRMPLLEIVISPATATWVTATCVEVGKQQGKTVIVVNDGPGFYTTRILGPYMAEAAHLLAEGVAVERIDEALKNFGFPVGPMTLLDEVGIDVAYKVSQTLHEAFGDRMKPVANMKKLVDDERRGRKNNKGLYQYTEKEKSPKTVDKSVYVLLDVEPRNAIPEQTIAERCVLQMVNEAAYCLGERILRSPRDGDIGAVFGLGFPPFLGGPFRYLDAEGCANILDRLEYMADRHGERFKPAPLIKKKQKFHS